MQNSKENKENLNNTFLSNKVVVLVLAVLCCLLWGSAFPCVKIAYRLFNISSDDTWTQILFAGIRFFTAGLMIYLTCLVFGRRLTVKKESVLNVFKLASVQTVLQYFFFYVGLAHTSGVKASIIEATTVFSTEPLDFKVTRAPILS